MKIVKLEDFHADAGYRTASYLKVTTDEGLVGWSEFYDSFSGSGIVDLIHRFGRIAIGTDPLAVGRLSANLHATTRLAAGGINHQAIAAIENACLDIKGKALGVPVYALFGGAIRERLKVYWTHCGSFRVRHPAFYEKELGFEPIRTLDDFTRIGREARAQGFTAVKTNPVFFDGAKPAFFNGGFRIQPGFLDRVVDNRTVAAIHDQLAALREGIGPETGLMMDLSFSQRPEGYVRIARAIAPLDMTWLELDIQNPEALAAIRQASPVLIASLESIYGLHIYRPYLAQQAVDVCIVDAIWNGVWQAAKIATLAEAHEVAVAPHNPIGDLANLMSAHLAAAIPNFRILEYRADEAPWTHQYLTHPVVVEKGELVVPTRPGWGSDIDEEALRAHPPREPR
jgi:L-alanine-DL-glutamate epimerase-like enolase superfamily enzyme